MMIMMVVMVMMMMMMMMMVVVVVVVMVMMVVVVVVVMMMMMMMMMMMVMTVLADATKDEWCCDRVTRDTISTSSSPAASSFRSTCTTPGPERSHPAPKISSGPEKASGWVAACYTGGVLRMCVCVCLCLWGGGGR